MTNELTVQHDIPQHLQAYRAQTHAEEYQVPGGEPIGILSLKGKAFSIKFKGETYPCRDENGDNRQFLDLLIVMAHPRVTKTFWLSGYDPDRPTPPDCYSNNGVTPEPDSPHLQHATCDGCPQNAWGSGPGKGKACRDNKRLAVLQLDDLDGQWFGGPQLLRVPPDSFNNFRQYFDTLIRERGLPPHAVVTRLRFDPNEQFRVTFAFVRYIDEDEKGWVEAWREFPEYAPITHRVLAVSDFEDTAPAEAPPVQAPKPVAATAPAQAAQPQRPRPANATASVEAPAKPAAAQRPAQAQRPALPAQAQAPQRPQAAGAPQRPVQARQAPGATTATPRPVPAAGGASRAPQRPVPAGNGQQAPQRPAPARAATPPAAARRPAPVRPAPVQAEPEYAEEGTDEGYDVDGAVDSVATNTLMSTLDDPPGIPGE